MGELKGFGLQPENDWVKEMTNICACTAIKPLHETNSHCGLDVGI